MKGQQKPGKWNLKGIVIGVIAGLVMILCMTGILTWLVLSGRLLENSVGYATVVILLLSSILAASIAIRLRKVQRLFTGTLTAVILGICLLGITALFFSGQYQGVTITIGVLLAGGIASALMEGREKKGSRHRKYRGTG